MVKKKINHKLKNKMDKNFERVYDKFLKNNISFRNTCYVDSLDNIYSSYQKNIK